jgi:glycosyltransferase involved in cell wall biosynthesis
MNALTSPVATVLITGYNTQPALLREAVCSGLKQTMPDLEVLVVDDGSIPPLSEHLKDIHDPRLFYHRIEHRGMPHALIAGVEKARGKYIAILDHDDRLTPDSIAARVGVIQNTNAGLVYGDIEFISADGEVIGHHAYPRIDTTDKLIRACLISPIAPLKHGAILFDREVALRLGNYDASMPIEYDLDLIIRIIKNHGFSKVNDFVAQYRVHPGNFSGSIKYRFRQIYYRWIAIDRYFPHAKLIKWAVIAYVAATNIAKACWQTFTYRRPGFVFPNRNRKAGASA